MAIRRTPRGVRTLRELGEVGALGTVAVYSERGSRPPLSAEVRWREPRRGQPTLRCV